MIRSGLFDDYLFLSGPQFLLISFVVRKALLRFVSISLFFDDKERGHVSEDVFNVAFLIHQHSIWQSETDRYPNVQYG